MTRTQPVEPFGTKLTTKSGNAVRLGTGSGTKWQIIKKARDASLQNTLVDELVDNLVTSVQNGFRHLDTAEIYTIHPEIAEAIKKSGVAREDLFVTTKYNPGIEQRHAFYKSGAESVDAALKEPDVEYIDLFLIHYPFFQKEYSHGQSLEDVWADLIQAKKDGKVRFIGGSNFTVDHLKLLSLVAGGDPEYSPQVNQIEFHPYLQNQSEGIREFAKENEILLEAYGPLSPLFRIVDSDGKEVVDHPLKPVMPRLAEKYGKTDAQILLRYTLQKGLLPITTSLQSDRQKEALAVYDFALDDEDVQLIDDTGSQFHFRGFFKNLYHTKD
ncbi:Aldo/keto reductase [Metschnikowia bicuspidata var. bicuspidata NRRL YB-4993]|uniref:2-dehydropantolactone reductase n=1 Tax=Metschnikowia bicuspidata var. bicuspidata NRRL YB-4993 TaxID=869754 RepID=A0A1A0HCM9_9ASCO|nr:Aldo/keto reductase [Metschnikowia bicuspidata var. bicuspidata NRRL YB-4993]OBA21647.1 Aldo/keto reductase [Metschnikowia bicuspidata var. bicuspidata NRRL YB-4993]